MLFRRLLATVYATIGQNANEKTPRRKAMESGTVDDFFGGENGGDWESGEQDDDGLSEMMGAFLSDFDDCGVDLSSLTDQYSDDQYSDETDPITAMMTQMEEFKLSDPCTDLERKVMRKEMLAFQQCSGYDVVELDEMILSAMMGVLVRCADAASMGDFVSMDIPEQCAVALLGNNPLGIALRDILLRPGETGDCFLELSHKVPQCTIDVWPFPVDGKSLKAGACIASKLDAKMNELCMEGLDSLNTCLPATKEEITSGSCDQCNESDSMYVSALMMMPPRLQGMPLPDTCSSTAMSRGMGSVVERYEAFRNTCMSEGVKLWTKLESDSLPSIESFQDFIQVQKTTQTVVEGKPHGEEKVNEKETLASQENAYSAEGVGDTHDSLADEDGGPANTFGYGMLTGVLLIGLSFVAFVVLRKKRDGVMPLPVETGASLEMGGVRNVEGKNTYLDVPSEEAGEFT